MVGKINVAVIGAGMLGGTVVKKASEIGIAGAVLNASKDDIDALELASCDNVSTFIIGDGKGTGKSRDIAKEFLIDHISVFEEPQIIDLITNADLIIVAGSAGGGFGSGVVPTIVNVLTEMYNGEKLFIPLTVLPDRNEQYTAQLHAENFMKEILDQEVPFIVYDNDKYRDLSASEMHKKTLDTIARDLKVLRGDYIVDYTHDGSNMDERDLLTAESTPGRLLIGVIDPVADSNNIVSSIKESIVNSAHAEIETDKVVMASATMYNLSEDILASNNIKHDLADIFGDQVTDYRNEAVYTGLGTQFIAVLLAGCSAPNTRIDQIVDLRIRHENIITSRKASVSNKLTADSNSQPIKLGVKNFGGGTTKVEPQKRQSVTDIMKKIQSK